MTSSLFTAAIILGVLFLFIYLLYAANQKSIKKNRLKKEALINQIVSKHKLELSMQEMINHSFLGLDKVNAVLIYIHFAKTDEKVEVIDLWDLKVAEVVSDYHNIYEEVNGKSVLADKYIEKLELELSLAGAAPKKKFCLYEIQDGLQQVDKIAQKANAWATQINEAVPKLPITGQAGKRKLVTTDELSLRA